MNDFESQENPFTDHHWYDKSWNVVIVLILFFPIGLYGLIKTTEKKQVLLKIGLLFLILFFGVIISNPHSSSSSSIGNVSQSRWDNSVDIVETYLKKRYLRDPDSYQSVKWYKVENNQDGTFQVTHTFRARNGFGGMNEETLTFIISTDGKSVLRHVAF